MNRKKWSLLENIETIVYYDCPLLYIGYSELDNLHYLVLLTDQENRSMIWLAAPMNQPQLDDLRSGKLQLRDPFLAPNGGMVYEVVERGGVVNAIRYFSADQVDKDDLPTEGEYYKKS